MQPRRHIRTTETGIVRVSVVVAVAMVAALVTFTVSPWGRNSGSSPTAFAQTGSVTNGPYTYHCDDSGNIVGSFTFSPSPATSSFSVFLTDHVPGDAQFQAVPGASQTFPVGSVSPVDFFLSVANVRPNANSIRIENSLNTTKSASFLCSELPPGPTSTPTRTPTNTSTPVPTNTSTPVPTNTNTPVPTDTNTPVPTNTNTPVPTNTSTPVPTNTSTPVPTNTNTPLPTNTNTPVPTDTNTPVPSNTNTPVPTNTNTPVPTSTSTPVPTNTNTPQPTSTNTAQPTSTSTPVPPTATNTATATPTGVVQVNSATPTKTNTPFSTVEASTAVPTRTVAVLPAQVTPTSPVGVVLPNTGSGDGGHSADAVAVGVMGVLALLALMMFTTGVQVYRRHR